MSRIEQNQVKRCVSLVAPQIIVHELRFQWFSILIHDTFRYMPIHEQKRYHPRFCIYFIKNRTDRESYNSGNYDPSHEFWPFLVPFLVLMLFYSKQMAAIVASCVEFEPTHRPSMSTVVKDLQALLNDLPEPSNEAKHLRIRWYISPVIQEVAVFVLCFYFDNVICAENWLQNKS